jgi:hypothetical protein
MDNIVCLCIFVHFLFLILFPCDFLYRYMEMDTTLYEKCSRATNDQARKTEVEREASALKWKSIMNSAIEAGIDVENL